MNTQEKDIESIINIIKSVMNVDPLENRRFRENTDARFILYTILREYLNLTYIKIGELVNKNHATVLHGCKKFKDLMYTDEEFRRNYSAIIKLLGDAELQSVIQSGDFVVDFVSLQIKHDAMQKKYDSISKSIEENAKVYVRKQFEPIKKSVISEIINDNGCTYELHHLLKGVLHIKENSVT